MKSQGLSNQIVFFCVAGFLAVATDYVIYKISLEFAGLIFSKLLGFYSGVFVSFLINSSITFKRDDIRFFSSKYFYRYFIVLSLAMIINVCSNYFILSQLPLFPKINLMAFSLATFLSMVFNFLSQKLFVFK